MRCDLKIPRSQDNFLAWLEDLIALRCDEVRKVSISVIATQWMITLVQSHVGRTYDRIALRCRKSIIARLNRPLGTLDARPEISCQ